MRGASQLPLYLTREKGGGGEGETDFLFSSLTCLRTPKKLLKGREGYAPFDSINDKHPHPSNVVCGCKVLYTHMFKVRVWKNARSPNNEKQKRLLQDKNEQSDICLCSIRFLQLTSFSIQGLIFFLGTDICLLTYVDLRLSSLS